MNGAAIIAAGPPLWPMFCKGMGQQALKAAADFAIALAGGAFEASPVRHGDAASALPDQPFLVKHPHDRANRGALGTNDLGEELMRERQGVLPQSIMATENPAAAPRFDAVNGIAGNSVQKLIYQSFSVVKDQPSNIRTSRDCLVHSVDVDPGGCARNLHKVAPDRLTGDNRTDKTEHSLATKYRHLGAAAVLHHIDQRHDDVMGEVGVTDSVASLVEDGASRQDHCFQVRLQVREVLRLKSRQKAVGSMVCRRSSLPHARGLHPLERPDAIIVSRPSLAGNAAQTKG
jgi:hypothetical protein